jgi:hypothetical protein
MTQQPQDDDLDPYEAWTRDRLTPLLGPLRRTDWRGGPSGLHDFEADLPNGSVAALEVTGEVDKKWLELAASAERHLLSITLPNSRFLWTVRGPRSTTLPGARHGPARAHAGEETLLCGDP